MGAHILTGRENHAVTSWAAAGAPVRLRKINSSNRIRFLITTFLSAEPFSSLSPRIQPSVGDPCCSIKAIPSLTNPWLHEPSSIALIIGVNEGAWHERMAFLSSWMLKLYSTDATQLILSVLQYYITIVRHRQWQYLRKWLAKSIWSTISCCCKGNSIGCFFPRWLLFIQTVVC